LSEPGVVFTWAVSFVAISDPKAWREGFLSPAAVFKRLNFD